MGGDWVLQHFAVPTDGYIAVMVAVTITAHPRTCMMSQSDFCGLRYTPMDLLLRFADLKDPTPLANKVAACLRFLRLEHHDRSRVQSLIARAYKDDYDAYGYGNFGFSKQDFFSYNRTCNRLTRDHLRI